MSNTPFVRTKPSHTNTVPEILACVLSLKPLSWGEYFFGRPLTEAIVGGAVYKVILRGETTKDVDVVCDDEKRFSELFTKNTHGAYCAEEKRSIDSRGSSFSPFQIDMNYNLIKFESKICHIDVGTFQQFAARINLVGLDMTNSLILTESGIRHILGNFCVYLAC